ncbi:PaaI family thioesterase [Aspergillus fischeri NRRL 181]|uniref:Thioesterase family protein n=1 Tax=Neosartorya fischeri (strain ATCC 1020 / DSM 3700 / CBS 544.65 / FGSC A1164 / JCM 1740 / NRRL 181 / WB 181) TaxID=331117 RepID=A1DDL0_NEOFI|nr:thioesterase family protein [Aspergillus fischeri NRRL 181]EAW17467.1 thioesterase family protein [Aspergillus fischeri NRRL 181]
MRATYRSDPTSIGETLAFFNTIPKCAGILSQPDLRVIHPRNPDAFFHSTLRSNNGILKSIFIYQPAHPHTRASDVSSSETNANATPQEREQEGGRERGYLLLHLGAGVSGQPDIAHGGFLATVLDQVTGTLIRASGLDRGRGAVTVYLNVIYKKPVRVPGVVVARAEVGRVDGRKIYVMGEISVAEADRGGEGEGVCVVCEGMFLVKRDGFGRI